MRSANCGPGAPTGRAIPLLFSRWTSGGWVALAGGGGGRLAKRHTTRRGVQCLKTGGALGPDAV